MEKTRSGARDKHTGSATLVLGFLKIRNPDVVQKMICIRIICWRCLVSGTYSQLTPDSGAYRPWNTVLSSPFYWTSWCIITHLCRGGGGSISLIRFSGSAELPARVLRNTAPQRFLLVLQISVRWLSSSTCLHKQSFYLFIYLCYFSKSYFVATHPFCQARMW
jgi:hypothetical protein